MRQWFFGVSLLACTVSSAADAQTWTSKPTLLKERSRAGCSDSLAVVGFKVDGQKLTITFNIGSNDLTVAPDGTVNESFTVSNRNVLQLTGNVNTRQFELRQDSAACRWAMPPQ